ncbi:hypothetical protein [Streptomyces sp. NPDC056144]|uniref:hypothetical protein n=1 Tax=unclassified Streptomyces TaxID=2593676 RepID=UPI0035E325BB
MKASGTPAGAPGEAAGRPPKRERAWALVACLTGLLLVVVAGWIVAVPVAAGERTEEAFRQAPRCAPETDGRDPECVSRRDGLVHGFRKEEGRQPTYWVGVPGPEGSADGIDWIRLEDGSSFTDRVRAGDAIALYSWRGAVRTVVAGGRVQPTAATPVASWSPLLGLAVGLFPVGLALLGCGLWWRARAASHPARSPWQISLIGLAGILPGIFLGVGVAVGASSVDRTLKAAAIVCAASAATVLLSWPFLARRERRRGVDIAFTPRRVSVGDVFPVFLPYEPLYEGFTFLVVRSGGLAMSTDPTGGVACRPLPTGLRLRRVRRQLRTDPGPGAGGGGRSFHQYHLAECETDDGRTLLVAGYLPQLERLAGALLSSSAPEPPSPAA